MVEQPTKGDEKTLPTQDKPVESVKAPNPDAETPPAQTKDKDWKTMQSYLAGQIEAKVKPLLAEIASLKGAKQSDSKRLATEAEIKRWVESGEVESEDKYRNFESVVEKYATDRQNHLEEVEAHKTKVAEFESEKKTIKATNYLVTAILPEADDTLKESLATMVKECETDREMKLMAEKLSVGLREKLIEALTGTNEKEVKRPDSSRTSGKKNAESYEETLKKRYPSMHSK